VSRAWLRRLLWAAVYASLVVWLTWPLAARMTTDVPDIELANRFDTLEGIWVLAWDTHALTTAPARLPDANMFHPAPSALFYGATELGAVPYFAPTFLATGNPVLAGNVLYLVGIALTALALHAVVVRWTGSEAAGFIAAWTLLLNPYVVRFVTTGPFLAVMLYLPWIAWLAARRTLSARAAAGLWLLVVAQMLVDPLYHAAAVGGVVATVAVVRLARPATRRTGATLVAVLALAVVAMAPVYAGYLTVRTDNPGLARQTLFELSTAARRLAALRLTARGLEGNPTTAMSIVTLLLIAAGAAVRLRRGGGGAAAAGWRHALLWTAVGLALGTGAVLVGGEVVVLPHAALAERAAPALAAVLRGRLRLGVVALVGFTLLAGLAFAELTRSGRRPPRRHVGVVGAGVAAVLYALALYRVSPPLGHQRYRTRPVLALRSTLLEAQPPEAGPVLELPVGELEANPALPGGAAAGPVMRASWYHARAMFRSIFHWRPLLNGYSSYWPDGFPARMALARRLPDPEALRALRADTGLGTIVVHANDLSDAERTAWLAIAADAAHPALRLVGRERDELVFVVR
jgi:hypothetical protein